MLLSVGNIVWFKSKAVPSQLAKYKGCQWAEVTSSSFDFKMFTCGLCLDLPDNSMERNANENYIQKKTDL